MITSLVVSGLLALTRPNFLFLPPLLALYLAWKLPERYGSLVWLRTTVLISLPFVILIGGWKIYQSISAYHFALTPDAFEDPILRRTLREHLARNPRDHHAIYNITRQLMQRWRSSWHETKMRLNHEAHKALRRRPGVFLRSVVDGIAEYFAYANINWGRVRSIIASGLLFLNLLGLFALFKRETPPPLRFGLVITLLNALVCSIAMGVHAEQARYAFPTEALLTISATWMLWTIGQVFPRRTLIPKELCSGGEH